MRQKGGEVLRQVKQGNKARCSPVNWRKTMCERYHSRKKNKAGCGDQQRAAFLDGIGIAWATCGGRRNPLCSYTC